MGEPITKQRLKNYVLLRRSVENQLERLARMKNSELIPAMQESDGSKRSPAVSSSKMENAIVRRLLYEDEIKPDVESKLAEMEAIRAAINRLPDPQEQDVLRFRYIDCEGYRNTPWRDIALKVYGDDDEAQMQMVFRVHGRALKNIAAMTEE